MATTTPDDKPSISMASEDVASGVRRIAPTVLSKVRRRLIPFLFLLYIVAYLDRINVGFAALQMNQALGFSATTYGLGAGMFFLSYVLFEIPSNVILARIGARLWIARIMITWGIVSSSMMFVRSPAGFHTLRFLLGAAEAGFFPGLIFYLTQWFPARGRAGDRARLRRPPRADGSARARALARRPGTGGARRVPRGGRSHADRPAARIAVESARQRTDVAARNRAFHHSGDALRTRLLAAADDQGRPSAGLGAGVGRKRLHGRYVERDSICFRRRRDGARGPAFGSHRRTPLAFCGCGGGRGRRAGGQHRRHRHRLVDRDAVDRDDRVGVDVRPVLGPRDHVSVGALEHGRCGVDRAGELGGQYGRVRRPVPPGCDQRRDAQLCDRALRDRRDDGGWRCPGPDGR